MNNCIQNAIVNSYRKKGARVIPLWEKKKTNKKSSISRKKMIEIAQEIDREDDKSWIRQIYQRHF